MKKEQFKDFNSMSKFTHFSEISYKHLKQISYANDCNFIKCKLSFDSQDEKKACILKETRNFTTRSFLQGIPPPVVQNLPPPIPKDKVDHIKTLSNQFSKVDLEYWKSIFKNF